MLPISERGRPSPAPYMEAFGYAFSEGDWRAPGPTAPALLNEADAMHALLVLRADKLGGCTEGSEGETDLKMISETVGAYEAKRWPDGKVPGGKG